MIGHTLEFTVPLRGVIFGGVSDHNHIQDDEREAGKRDEGRNQIERNHGDEQDQRHDADRGHLRNDEGYVGGDVLGSLDGGIYHGGRSAPADKCRPGFEDGLKQRLPQ